MAALSGRSVFYKDATGAVFHTYSAYARGGENFSEPTTTSTSRRSAEGS